MSKYYVYRKSTRELVHVHEQYDAVSGDSVPCSVEEVLALVDEAFDKSDLNVVEGNSEAQTVRVNTLVEPKSRTLETRADN